MNKWNELTEEEQNHWNGLAKHLKKRSDEICKDNECTEDEHRCESMAYITAPGCLVDVCIPDYWQGWGEEDRKRHGEISVIALPVGEGGAELYEEAMEGISDYQVFEPLNTNPGEEEE